MTVRIHWLTILKLLALGALSVLLLSCEAVSYYAQAARGQISILSAREDIHRLLHDKKLSSDQRSRFELVLALRRFAQDELALPVADNYSAFVEVGREHVVWNVFAAPEFSTKAVNWCYPIAGCVTYRGYFNEQNALRYARRLEAEGFDVYTGGVDAYSTLGWFDDPLLSTVMKRSDWQLAGLIFHELAHQVVYVQADTTFNESFATAVEREGIRRWLLSKGQDEWIVAADVALSRQQDFVELVIRWRNCFAELYEQQLTTGEMRTRKQLMQQQMRADYLLLKQRWDGYAGYDSWFSRSLNNAQLSTVASYNDLVPSFDALLMSLNGDMSAFYSAVRQLAQLPMEERAARLASITQ
ncbi:MAG: aminopeptidase [Gammaproteobacteria bacterium]|nr:aminopeptidase [Gammaproteobacteria bacterium]